MSGTIDAHGQPAGDDKTDTGQATRKRSGSIQRRRCSTPTAHYRQLRTLKQFSVAGDEQQRRRIVDFGQQRWITRAVPHQ
ncbi:hypothetical protein D3C71_2120660 [compost metagenome]